MTRKLFASVIISLAYFGCFGQNQLAILSKNRLNDWSGNADLFTRLYKFYVRTDDGGIIWGFGHTGSAACPTSSATKISSAVFMKFDPTGSFIQWERCYGLPDSLQVIGIFPQKDNGFVELGHLYPYWMARKRDASDNIVWEKRYNIPTQVLDFVTQMPDGDYMFCGRATGNNGGNSDIPGHYGGPFNYDVVICRTDSLGNKKWVKNLGGTYDEFIDRIIPTADGGCFLIGNTQSDDYDATGYHGMVEIGGDFWIVRLDSLGNTLWHKCYGGNKMDVAADAFAFSNGDLFIAGTNRSIDGDIQNHLGIDGSLNVWILRTDTAGTIKWQKSYGTNNDATGFITIATDNIGQVWATGVSQGKSPFLSDTAYGGLWDAAVWRLDTFGNVTGQRVIGTPQNDMGLFIAPMSGNVVLAGGNYTPPITNETTPSDTTSFTSVYFNIIGNWTTDVTTPTLAEKSLMVYPNPSDGTLNIQTSESGTISIYSTDGKIVFRDNITKPGITTTKVTGIVSGFYHLQFQTDKGKSSAERIIIK